MNLAVSRGGRDLGGETPLLARHGDAITAQLARIYSAPWPRDPIRVDLSVYANWAGAYTTVEPLRLTIATGDPHNQEAAALEILMHEASHGLVDGLRERLRIIVAEQVRRHPNADASLVRRDLWHEALFYVTGQIVAERIPGYLAYADRNELWQRAWAGRDREALQRSMTPLIAGKTTQEQALSALVGDLLGISATSAPR